MSPTVILAVLTVNVTCAVAVSHVTANVNPAPPPTEEDDPLTEPSDSIETLIVPSVEVIA